MKSLLTNAPERQAEIGRLAQQRADVARQHKVDFAECWRFRSNLPQRDQQFLECIKSKARLSPMQERLFFDICDRIEDLLAAAQAARPVPDFRRQIPPARVFSNAGAVGVETLRLALLRRRFGLTGSVAGAICDLHWAGTSQRRRA